jgi:lipopolysaccharide biosynthesis glycosyltransferase
MLKVFIGYDHRQPISYNVLQHSVFRNSSKPVSITALKIDQLPIGRTGLTPFTFSRFLVPYLCDYKGWALFLDSDILVKGDIAELFNLSDDKYTVMVSKNEKRFEWASVMLFNNEK